jgi:hypothetical protein
MTNLFSKQNNMATKNTLKKAPILSMNSGDFKRLREKNKIRLHKVKNKSQKNRIKEFNVIPKKRLEEKMKYFYSSYNSGIYLNKHMDFETKEENDVFFGIFLAKCTHLTHL